ncbi:MAG: NAD(P)-dependent alcohol dehydrogenase [Deltaproteobacteria bacterium]
MRAVLYDRFGDPRVLRIGETAEPSGACVVDVTAAALNPKDVLMRKGKFSTFVRAPFPRLCGYDFAGQLDGREVFGMINGMLGRTCAERVAVDADELADRPSALTPEPAASIPLAGQTALQALRDDGGLKRGQHAVINGASGGVGTLAIQIAKALGARVTSITSAKNRELCTELGADEALAYDETDPLANLRDVDVFFDVFGNRSLADVRPGLARRATLVSTVPNPRVMLEVARTVLSQQRTKLVVVKSRRRDLELLAGWADDGALKAVVDRTYAMEEIAEAHRHIESKRTRGKVVVRIRAE